MRVLCIADNFIPEEYMREGLTELANHVDEIVYRTWPHATIPDLQKDNLLIEQGGPEAVQTPENLFTDINTFEVVITQFCPIPSHIISKATRLKIIGVLRGGVENIALQEANDIGIRVINTPGRNAEAVAEFTIGMIIAESRNIARSMISIRDGGWAAEFPNAAMIPEVEGKTVGIVGMGRIGHRVAKFLQAMDAATVFYDPMVLDAPGCTKYDSLVEMAHQCDILTVHARLTPDTHRIISREVLDALPQHAIFINTARSGLVDEDALLDTLTNHRIMGAALDTFGSEPLESDSPFRELENVTVTGHRAGATADAFRKTPMLLAPLIVNSLGTLTSVG